MKQNHTIEVTGKNVTIPILLGNELNIWINIVKNLNSNTCWWDTCSRSNVIHGEFQIGGV